MYLQLQVKASPKWRRNETMLERLGSLMALLRRIGDELVVTLNDLEKAGALRGDVHVPFSAVRSVRVSTSPFVDLKGCARRERGSRA